MAKYRKKPVVIEAVQWTGDNETELALFMNKAFRKNPKNCYELEIPTLEGLMTASIGDYIIKGVKGEFYPCKPDVFAMIHEPIDIAEELIEFQQQRIVEEYMRCIAEEYSKLNRYLKKKAMNLCQGRDSPT